MTGKQKCRILRQIRRDIAAANRLDYTERDCTHQGECLGTCPYCEAQLKKLEGELEIRRSLGQRIAVMGLSMGLLATNLTACDNPFSRGRTTQGDMVAPESTAAQTEVANDIPGELIAAETTTVPPLKGDMPVEVDGLMHLPETEVVTATMGDPILPETEAVTATMGVLPLPEPEKDTTGTKAVETEPELMGTIAVTTMAIAGGIGPAPELPAPDEAREAVTIAAEEPLKTP